MTASSSLHWNLHGVVIRVDSEISLPTTLTYPFRHYEIPEEPADWTLSLRRGALAEPSLPGAQAVHWRRASPVRGAIGTDQFWLGCDTVGILGDLQAGTVEVLVARDDALADPVFLRTMLPVALLLHMQTRGLWYLHAAAGIDPEGRGWIFVGKGGAGKSTTLYALIRRGWRYLGDDGLLLRQDPAGLVALSFMDELHLTYASEQLFPELCWTSNQRLGHPKGIVDLGRLYPGAFATSTPVHRVVHLRPPGCDAGSMALLKDAIADNPLVYFDRQQRHLDTLVALATHPQRGWLEVGPDSLMHPTIAVRW